MSASIFTYDTISLDDVRDFCPAEVAAIESHPSFPGWGRIFDLLDYDPEELYFHYDEDFRSNRAWPSLHEDFCALWTTLHDAFELATQGADLGLAYIDKRRCDRNDRIPTNERGCIFTVERVHEKVPTVAGRVMEGRIQSALFSQNESPK